MGLEAFCYYRTIGLRVDSFWSVPFKEVVSSGKPDFPILPLLGQRNVDWNLARGVGSYPGRTDLSRRRGSPRALRIRSCSIRGRSIFTSGLDGHSSGRIRKSYQPGGAAVASRPAPRHFLNEGWDGPHEKTS